MSDRDTSNGFEELRLVGASRTFGGPSGARVAALRDLSLVVKRGEFIALLGPSGCGKSTALNCIAGLLQLSSGGIWLDERRIDTLPPEKRGFGMVFQNYALFPHMTVRKNVGFGLLMRGVPTTRARARVENALKLVQLEGQGDKLPGQLSGGQQQRVAIARAIVIEPPLVLMDEPLSNLDAKLRLETRAEIRRIHRDLGRSTIYVTHDHDEALSLADRIVVLREGMVQQVASPQEVFGQPANLHVARFMGYRNVIDFEAGAALPGGTITLHREGLTLVGTLRQPLAGKRVSAAIRTDDVEIARAAPSARGGGAAAPGPSFGTRPSVGFASSGGGTGRPAVGPGAPATPHNTFPALVESVEYSGRESTIELSVLGGIRMHVRTSTPVAVGDQVHLTVPAERVLVYPLEA